MQLIKKVTSGERSVQESSLAKEQVAHIFTTQRVSKNIPLGELFIHSGLLTPDQLQAAFEHQKKTKLKLGTLLVEKGWITETALTDALSFQSQLALRPVPQSIQQKPQKAQGKFTALINTQ